MHFPKSFSSVSNLFGHKTKKSNGPAAAPPPAQSPPRTSGMDGLPPRRTATSTSGVQTDRRGPPPSSFRSSQRPDAARTSTNESKAAKLLGSISVREMDKMSHAQLGQVIEILGGPRASSVANAPLSANWQRLRKAFTEKELHAVMLKDPNGVVEVLMKPARAEPQRPNARPEGPRRPQPSRPGPGPQPGAKPQGPQGSQAPRASSQRPALQPISIVGMDRQTAFKALAARGMTRPQLEQMKVDFFQQVNNGNTAKGAALSEKYKAFIKDDLSTSDTYAAYAKLLVNLSGFGA